MSKPAEPLTKISQDVIPPSLWPEREAWYVQKLKECLVSLHSAACREKEARALQSKEREELHSRLHDVGTIHQALKDQYDELGLELTRLRKYNPERLPSFLKIPIKALIVLMADGPLELIRTAKRR